MIIILQMLVFLLFEHANFYFVDLKQKYFKNRLNLFIFSVFLVSIFQILITLILIPRQCLFIYFYSTSDLSLAINLF